MRGKNLLMVMLLLLFSEFGLTACGSDGSAQEIPRVFQ